jgi:hypothetical protein
VSAATAELVVATMTPDEARLLTDDIKVALSFIWELVRQAWDGHAWEALGYESWSDYCRTEFPDRPQISREARPELIAAMREAGMSLRAIEAATGLSKSTVGRELSAVPNGTLAQILEQRTLFTYADVTTPTEALEMALVDLNLAHELMDAFLETADLPALVRMAAEAEECRVLAMLGTRHAETQIVRLRQEMAH